MNCNRPQPTPTLYQSDHFTIYADRVEQGEFTCKALSRTHLESNYQSPANAYQPAEIVFKFSINGRDNEMPPGVDHRFAIPEGHNHATTPVIDFGTPYITHAAEGVYLQPNTRITIRCNMKKVLEAFEKDGFYTTYQGEKIYKQDFKGVFIAGANAPLSWDFDNLDRRPQFQLSDSEGDGIYEITLTFNEHNAQRKTAASWQPKHDLSQYPIFKSDYLIADALYNLALDEMINALEPDGTLRTGKEWAGVWTRDVSYSTLLAMAILQPLAAKTSLMRKVQNDRIIQDTGTGGAWPISTDRMIWAAAAFEIYKVTGDEDWLKYATQIVKNSIDDDLLTAKDPLTGLMRGESSFLDWREQTYPKWMQPADIYTSLCLGTNAVHYAAMMTCAAMCQQLGQTKEAEKYAIEADMLKKAINQHLWNDNKSFYNQYLYGRMAMMASPRAEALGQALCVLWDIASPAQATKLLTHSPVTPFGTTCIYPQTPLIPPYHNNAIWPFVQSFWGLAAAKAKNESAFIYSLASVYRAAGMFLTNKENMVADNGDFAGTVINSDNMLWSLSGSLGLVYKGLFGLNYEVNGLYLRPFVPKSMSGHLELKQFKYRNAILHIHVEGHGHEVASASVNGQPTNEIFIPHDATGELHIVIKMNGQSSTSKINMSANHFAPNTPVVKLVNNQLSWKPISEAVTYLVYKNGQLLKETTDTTFNINDEHYAHYQVVAQDAAGWQSFASEPVEVFSPKGILVESKPTLPPSAYRNDIHGYSGKGFVETSITQNPELLFELNIPENGQYLIRIRYANGNGPVNTENKCAIRTLYYNDKLAGTMVLPQRGHQEWANWGWSNYISHPLAKGKQVIKLKYEPWNRNMHGSINHAYIDRLECILLK